MGTKGSFGYKIGKKIRLMRVNYDADLLWQILVREIYVLIKHYKTIEDHHFFTYPFRVDDFHLARNQDALYRKGIRSARVYSRYRYEILLLIYVLSTALIFSRCGW